MENISYIGLSQQMALQRQMDVTANNLANMNTPGFKGEDVLFLDYLNKPRGGDAINQVLDYNSYRNLDTGPLTQTHNKLDFAIAGEGYFAIQTKEGIRYTRDGSFALNEKREIVNKSGFRLMNESSNPLVVPPDAARLTMTADGTLSSENGIIGKVQVVNFESPQAMRKIGNNLYDAGELQKKNIENLRVVQGSVEGSNVNPITEMNRMVEVLRMYQATQRMLLTDHERIRSAIQKLTKA